MAQNFVQKFVEELILIILILMNIFEFLGLLPGDVEFIKAIISMSALGYVLYKANLSDILFGSSNNNLNFTLIFSYFLLIVNKFVEFSKATLEHSAYLREFFEFITNNSGLINSIAFFTGSIMILIITLYVILKIQIKEPSIVQTILNNQNNKFTLFITVFIVVFGFHQIFFNLVMEWLTLVIDAPLIILAIFLYMFKLHDLSKAMDQEVILFKIADFVEDFVADFINLFHSKRTILLGISGMLVLHLLTDVGAFIIPYTFGTQNIYSEELGENHLPIKDLFNIDKELITDKGQQTILFFGYILNTIGYLYLMIFPAFIWYIMYLNYTKESDNTLNYPDSLISLFFSTMVFVLFLPVYKITKIGLGLSEIKNLLGVDIQTQSILSSGNPFLLYSSIALGIFLAIFLLSKIGLIKKLLFFMMTLFGLGFFGLYIYYFFSDMVFFYLDFIKNLFILQTFKGFYFAIYNSIILFILALFYIGGFFSFVITVFKPE